MSQDQNQQQPSKQYQNPPAGSIPTSFLRPLHMHEWESQDKVLSDLQNQEVKNCLEYVDFRFLRHEWDNIPVIVPRYLFYLSKYINGLATFCYNVEQQESTESIREDLNEKYYDLLNRNDEMRKTDLKEKDEINQNFKDLKNECHKIDSFIKDLNDDNHRWLNTSMYDMYSTPENKIYEYKDYKDKDCIGEAYQRKARLYSLNQIKDLFHIHLNRSKLCHRFWGIQTQMIRCENDVKQLFKNDESIRAYIDEKVNQLTDRLDKFDQQNTQQQSYHDGKLSEINSKLYNHGESILKLQDFQKEANKNFGDLKSLNDKTNAKIVQERDTMNQLLDIQCNELRVKISNIDQYTQNQIDAMQLDFDRFKHSTKESIDNKERSIMNKTNTYVGELRKYVEETANDLNQKRQEMQEKYDKKFGNVKEVITNYFEKYDSDLEEMKINMKALNQKYADWSKILIEPSSLNEARLYSLETRMHEEEEIRIKEYEYVRDLMKKLIFSLEQTNLQNLDIAKSSAYRSMDRADAVTRGSVQLTQHQQPLINLQNLQSPQLPNLLQTQGMNSQFKGSGMSSQGGDKPNPSSTLNELSLGLQHKTNEILMLKRLNFLKTSLDSHSPRQTTTNLRLKAVKKRDDRVYEIWRKELEAPTVHEILANYLKNKHPVNVDLEKEINEQSFQPPQSSSNKQKIQAQARIPQIKTILTGGTNNSRNLDVQSQQNLNESEVKSKRGEITLQPLSTGNVDTSVSNLKASNDSAFITQKMHMKHQFGQTFHPNMPFQQNKQQLNTVNIQSLQSIDQSVRSNNLADKINRNKFLTNSDNKKINNGQTRGHSNLRDAVGVRDKLYETFWSDFDNSIVEKSRQLQNPPKMKVYTHNRPRGQLESGPGRQDQDMNATFSHNEDRRNTSMIDEDLNKTMPL
ncbi:UNKNOWN [Stylonychia lemnae]|uniref:Uncharacterized protein n=1 Tax=Stylonychia lemnae TaxID=5949 RepID=A0A078A3K6_STYLE|nr:UNKNOWN [Stylonychia lemnae]|eukprot:CDW76392.1 UNKNOWN [Stylonychia lemnae]